MINSTVCLDRSRCNFKKDYNRRGVGGCERLRLRKVSGQVSNSSLALNCVPFSPVSLFYFIHLLIYDQKPTPVWQMHYLFILVRKQKPFQDLWSREGKGRLLELFQYGNQRERESNPTSDFFRDDAVSIGQLWEFLVIKQSNAVYCKTSSKYDF